MATTPTSVKVGNPSPASTNQTSNSKAPQKPAASQTAVAKPVPWKTLLGLTLILAELWLNTGVIWGLFMLLWAIMGINSGQTYILEILDRKVHPILFWFTIHLWLLFAAFFFMGNNHIYGLTKTVIVKVVNLVN